MSCHPHPRATDRRHSAVFGHAARLLMVLPLVFFALFSAGTMIEAAPAGGMRIVLCTGDGMVDAIMTPDGQIHRDDGQDPDRHAPDAPCDWALHAQPVLTDAAASLVPPLIHGIGAAYRIDIPLHRRRADVLTPAARGPPTLV